VTTMHRHRVLVLIAVVGLILAACGGSTQGVAQQGAAATVAAPSTAATTLPFPDVVMPKDLLGVWTANVQRPGPSNGLWRIRITEHLMELKNPAAASDSDYFWLWTDRIDDRTFHMAADADCPAATYTWSVQASQLVMTTTDDNSTNDPCSDRMVTLPTPFTRQP